jgi:origin recognition complex subunit 1
MRTHENLCRTYGEPLPPAGCAAGVVCRLASQRLLLCDPGRKRSAQRVSLNMGRDDLVYALKETRVEKAIAAAAAAAARRERTGGGVGGIGGENGAGDAASAEGERGLDHGDIPWMKHLGL